MVSFPSVERFAFGRLPNGRQIGGFRLDAGTGVSVTIIEYGATITSIVAPDRHGQSGEITLGCDTLEDYLAATHYFGAVVGRSAGRIASAQFELDGYRHHLAANAGADHLHGGIRGFDKCVWTGEPELAANAVAVTLALSSPDGDEGYPGRLDATVRYGLNAVNELSIDFTASTDRATPVSLTQHAYFNLSGTPDRGIGDHLLTIESDAYIPAAPNLLPAGGPAPLRSTPFDFRNPTRIGARIDDPDRQLEIAGGYDHSYVLWLDRSHGKRMAARLYEPTTGRLMDVRTTEPCLHLYTGNFLGAGPGRGGALYPKRAGLALESQHFADSPNRPGFPSTILRPGRRYRSETTWRFGVDR